MFMDAPPDIFSWVASDQNDPYRPLRDYGIPEERMLFILDDGSALMVGGGRLGSIDLPLKKIREQLEQRGKGWANVTHTIHNHGSRKGFSPSDHNVNTVLRKLGFAGEFQVYYPKIGIARTLKQETK